MAGSISAQIIGSMGGIGGIGGISSCMSRSASSLPSISNRSGDGHSRITGARLAFGAVVGSVGLVVFGAAGVGAGVGFWAPLDRAQTHNAAAVRVALIILPSFRGLSGCHRGIETGDDIPLLYRLMD